MTYAVWIPLLIPLLAVPAARSVSAWLSPRFAAWMLHGCTVVLAVCSTAALGLLAINGALGLAPVARLGRISPTLLEDHGPVMVLAAWPAAGLLVFVSGRAVRAAVRLWREWRSAHDAATGAGELSVQEDRLPYAYALPGLPGRPGRIVVSAAMLSALRPGEHEVLYAHERAHLTGRHHLFLAATELAVALNPLLRGLHEPLAYALERWADESAAAALGDHRLVARAISRAALAAHEARTSAVVPTTMLSIASGRVPRRVAALMSRDDAEQGNRMRPVRRALAVGLLGCIALSGVSALHATGELHEIVEGAQHHAELDLD